jgi:transcriptional regulator with XRE-family HTH domain
LYKLEKIRKSIGRALRDLRLERRWSQGDLAEKLGVSQSRISDVERGRRSLTAEQLVYVLTLFNATVRQFAPDLPSGSQPELQNTLARLGAAHLQESEWVLPSERVEHVHDAIREILVDPSPRLVTGLAPVIVQNIDHLSLGKIYARLADLGLQRRLGWLTDNINEAVQAELWRSPPRSWVARYRRTNVLLQEFLTRSAAGTHADSGAVDILDTGIRSKKTLAEVQAANSSISQRWGIITSIQPQDFVDALEAAHGDH